MSRSWTVIFRRPVLAGLIFCVGLDLATAARAADAVLEAAVPLQKPRKNPPRLGGPLDKVEVHIWLPEGAKVVRGAIVNPFNLKQVEQAHWREAARLWDFAVVGANYSGVHQVDYPTLGKTLKEFAARSGRKELEHLPLCFVGMSAGAGMSVKFAELMPERTLAVAPVCLEVGPNSPATRNIPMLTIFGEKDGKQMQQLTDKLPVQRREGALWAIAVQWGRRHEFGQANNLVMPFFDDVIQRRYPGERSPTNGSVQLLDYPEAKGWLADPGKWGAVRPAPYSYADYAGDKGAACWLPTPRVASVWSAFVSRSEGAKIMTPAGLGDGQPFTAHAPDRPIRVRAETAGKGKPARVELLDGYKIIGQRTEAPYEFEVTLSPGIHPLIVVVTQDDGKQAVSRPHTLVVRRK